MRCRSIICISTDFGEPVNAHPGYVHLLLPELYQCAGGARRGGCTLRLVELEATGGRLYVEEYV